MADYVDVIGRWGKGNIDLNDRIVLYNADGSIDTEKPFTTTINDKIYLLPTIVNGSILTQPRAIQSFNNTGKYLGIFNTVAQAKEYANALYERQVWYYTKRSLGQKFYFKIGGVDIAPFIAYKGIKWTRNDIDSANAGRTLSGLMNRGRVCMKVKLDVKCRPLKQREATMIMNLINPEYVNVDYIDPLLGARNVQFYSNNVPATFCMQTDEGEMLWDDLSFPLVER